MTVSVAGALERTYAGNGATTAFSYPVRFSEASEIVVILRDADGLDAVQSLTTHYSLSAAPWTSGATVTFVTAPASGETVIIYRETLKKQAIDLANAQRNDVEAVEAQLDRMSMADQDMAARISRAVKVDYGADGQMLPAPEAGHALGWVDGKLANVPNSGAALDSDLTAIAALAKTDGNIIVGNGTAWVAESGATARTSLGANNADNLDTGTLPDARLSFTVTTFAKTVLDDTDAATMRATVGAISQADGDARYVLKSDWVDAVNDFAATGDGVTDDTSAIQAAIDSLSAGVVYIPSGTYLVDSLTLKETVAIRGANDGSTILMARSNSINILTMEATSATKTHVDISNIKFDGNGKTSVTAVYLNGVSSSNRISYVRLENLHVTGCNEGLHLYYCANTNIDQCFVTGTTFGIHLDMCADTDVFGSKVQNGSDAGFYIVGGAGAYDEGVRLIGCSTNGQQIGLWVDGQEWGIVEGCSLTTAPGGAALFSNACSNWKLNGCEFAVAGGTPAAAGLIIGSSCTDFIVSNSLFALNTFGISSSGTRVSITGNQFKANSNVDIYLNATTKSVINSNICDSTGSAWSILEAGAADYNNIIGNTVNGTVTIVGANSAAANNLTY